MDDQPVIRELVLALAERLLRDLAAGCHPIYWPASDVVTPLPERVPSINRIFADFVHHLVRRPHS